MAPPYSVPAENVAAASAETSTPGVPVTSKAVGNEIPEKPAGGMGAAPAVIQPMRQPTAEPVGMVTTAGGSMGHEADKPSSGETISGVQYYTGVLSDRSVGWML